MMMMMMRVYKSKTKIKISPVGRTMFEMRQNVSLPSQIWSAVEYRLSDVGAVLAPILNKKQVPLAVKSILCNLYEKKHDLW